MEEYASVFDKLKREASTSIEYFLDSFSPFPGFFAPKNIKTSN
jgi:hypothetical protein